jgi:hypothetical protein
MSKQWNGPPQSPLKLRTNAPKQTEEQVAPRYRQPKRVEVDEDENVDVWQGPRPHTSAVRYDRPPRRETTLLPPTPATKVLYRRFNTGRLLTLVGLSMMVMVLGFMSLSWLGNWWTTTTNDWNYGRPRTFQVDHVVGHQDNAAHPSHFIAQNLNRRIVVIEIPGGDPTTMQVYIGPTLVGDGQDLTPLTLTFEDRNGDGKPDLNIHIGDQVIVFLNNGTKFYPAPQQQ